jgi:hypothetical protein
MVFLGRQQSNAAGWRWCGSVAQWRCVTEFHAAVVAAGGRLAQIWATRARDGLRLASDGIERAKALRFLVIPGGGGDNLARIGTTSWPMCCSSVSESLRVHLGLAGPTWA